MPLTGCDLVVLSEVCYYIDPGVLRAVLDREVPRLSRSATVLAAHWRHRVADYPMSGDHANDLIGATAGLHHLGGYRDADVAIEVFDPYARIGRCAHGCSRRLVRTHPSSFVLQYFSLTLVVGHRCGAVELIGGLGVPAEPCE